MDDQFGDKNKGEVRDCDESNVPCGVPFFKSFFHEEYILQY